MPSAIINGESGASVRSKINESFTDLTGKAATVHTHVIADVTNLQTTLDGKADSSHTHSIANVTGLQTALDAKQATLVSASNIKTVNGNSLLGAGDITVAGSPGALNDLTDVTITTPATGQVLKYNGSQWVNDTDATGGGGTGVTDGDKGDIVVSSTGAVWTIDNGAVTNAKAADMATGTIKARITSGTGDPEDATASQVKTLLAIGISDVATLQTELDAKLDSDLATAITATKVTPIDGDELILIDSADADTAKVTTVGGIRTRINNLVVGTGLGTTGTVNLDLAALTGTLQTIAATGNITFTTSNRLAGRFVELRIAAGASSRTITWPAWVAFGAALPTTLASGKVLRVAISCTGTTDGSIDAAAAESV